MCPNHETCRRSRPSELLLPQMNVRHSPTGCCGIRYRFLYMSAKCTGPLLTQWRGARLGLVDEWRRKELKAHFGERLMLHFHATMVYSLLGPLEPSEILRTVRTEIHLTSFKARSECMLSNHLASWMRNGVFCGSPFDSRPCLFQESSAAACGCIIFSLRTNTLLLNPVSLLVKRTILMLHSKDGGQPRKN